jgi:hypothetical protein
MGSKQKTGSPKGCRPQKSNLTDLLAHSIGNYKAGVAQ